MDHGERGRQKLVCLPACLSVIPSLAPYPPPSTTGSPALAVGGLEQRMMGL